MKKKQKQKGRKEVAANRDSKDQTDADNVIKNCYAIGSGDRGSWTFSLIKKDEPSAGIQIDYTDGQECFKRVVQKTKTETGREKREVKWVPTPRSTTIKMTCNPYNKDTDITLDGKKSGNIERVIGKTQSIHAVEDEMCHYTLSKSMSTWDLRIKPSTKVINRMLTLLRMLLSFLSIPFPPKLKHSLGIPLWLPHQQEN